MRAGQWMGWGLILACLALVTGCHPPAQILWSPDGSAAVYRGDSDTILMDSSGKIFSRLGKSDGGMAWSKNSKTLYYVNAVTDGEVATADPAWLISIAAEANSATKPADPETDSHRAELKSVTNGKTTLLARFAGGVLHIALSPDENWLALCGEMGAADTGLSIYVYHLPTKHLYQLSNNAGTAMCFTGPNKLVIEEQDLRSSSPSAVPGRLVEVTLDAKAPPAAENLLSIIPSETAWTAAVGENLLFTTMPHQYPGKYTKNDNRSDFKLFQWTRANGSVVSIADDVGPLFAVSPDGQRVLIERVTPNDDKDKEKHTLEVIRSNGSDGHALRDLGPYNDFAIWPAWRGNDEITFTNPVADGKRVPADGKVHVQYEVVQYKLTDKFELSPIATLSDSWDAADKPFVEINNAPGTQPTTMP